MSRVCPVNAKRVVSGNNVSHSHRKTKRKFLPNLQNVTLLSEKLGDIKLRLSTAGLRSIEKAGGIDQFLLSTSPAKLSALMSKLRRIIEKVN